MDECASVAPVLRTLEVRDERAAVVAGYVDDGGHAAFSSPTGVLSFAAGSRSRFSR